MGAANAVVQFDGVHGIATLNESEPAGVIVMTASVVPGETWCGCILCGEAFGDGSTSSTTVAFGGGEGVGVGVSGPTASVLGALPIPVTICLGFCAPCAASRTQITPLPPASLPYTYNVWPTTAMRAMVPIAGDPVTEIVRSGFALPLAVGEYARIVLPSAT